MNTSALYLLCSLFSPLFCFRITGSKAIRNNVNDTSISNTTSSHKNRFRCSRLRPIRISMTTNRGVINKCVSFVSGSTKCFPVTNLDFPSTNKLSDRLCIQNRKNCFDRLCADRAMRFDMYGSCNPATQSPLAFENTEDLKTDIFLALNVEQKTIKVSNWIRTGPNLFDFSLQTNYKLTQNVKFSAITELRIKFQMCFYQLNLTLVDKTVWKRPTHAPHQINQNIGAKTLWDFQF